MRVMVFGTFDQLHPGHLDYFRQAWSLAEELIIIVARDINVLKTKKHQAQEREDIRLQKVQLAFEKYKYKGRVVLGDLKNIWLVLEKYQPDIIALGYDQNVDLERLDYEIKKNKLDCKIVRLKAHHPEKYKSSLNFTKVD